MASGLHGFVRALRHLFATPATRWFPSDSLQRIAAAIAEGETRHDAQLCFAVESALPVGALLRGIDPRTAAQAAFARLRVWDTAGNNGVLVYLLVADRRIEIVADRGLHGRVDAGQWQTVCAVIEGQVRAGQPEAAVIAGVQAVSALLAANFPRMPGQPSANELPDLPHILR